MAEKVGLHVTTGSRDGYGLTAPKAAVIVATIGGAFDEAGPNAFRVYRPIEVYEDIFPNFEQASLGEMVGYANQYWPLLKARIQQVEAAHGPVDAVQLTNEIGGNSRLQIEKLIAYEQRLMSLCELDGYTLCVANNAPNSPDWHVGLWHELFAPHIREAWGRGHIYSRHVYFDVPPYDDNWLRMTWELDHLRSLGPTGPVLITELGYVSFPGVTQFISGINGYTAMMAEPEIGGGAIFTYGEWVNANIQSASAELAELMGDGPPAKWQPVYPVDQSPPPDPEPGDGRGRPRIQYTRVVNVVPQDADEESAVAIFRQAWSRAKETVGGSYDDAGIGDLDYRLARLWDIPEGQRPTFVDWYATHYPGVTVEFAQSAPAGPLLANPLDRPLSVTSVFNDRRDYSHVGGKINDWHEGLDLRANIGEPVRASISGTVNFVQNNNTGGYGRYVRVRTDLAGTVWTLWYTHLNSTVVQVGQQLQVGQELGLAGMTGNADGPHLHLTVQRQPGGLAGYIVSDVVDPGPLLGLPATTLPGPGGTPPPPPEGPARIGLHAGADSGDLSEIELAEFRAMRPGVIKVLSSHSGTSISRLAMEHPQAAFIVRAFLDFGDRVVTPAQFVEWTISDVQRAVQAIGAGRQIVIELHNEPNLAAEGLWRSWMDGREFADWLTAVASMYRAHLPAGVRLMFPGLSPGYDIANVRQGHASFLTQATRGIDACDDFGAHVYWSNTYPMGQALNDLDGIIHYRRGKPVWVTEASHNRCGITPAQKGQQYLQFWQGLRQRAMVQGVTYFVASASNAMWGWGSTGHCEVWVENGQQLGIGAVIGGRP